MSDGFSYYGSFCKFISSTYTIIKYIVIVINYDTQIYNIPHCLNT